MEKVDDETFVQIGHKIYYFGIFVSVDIDTVNYLSKPDSCFY